MSYKATLIEHKNQSRIAVYFPNNAELKQRFKTLPDSKWSQTLKVWHIPDTPENRIKFKVDVQAIPQNQTIELQAEQPKVALASTIPTNSITTTIYQYKSWLKSKRYSESTIKVYSEALYTFLLYFQDKHVSEISNDDLIIFNNDYILKKQLSSTYQNQIVNAIKLFFAIIQNRSIDIQLIHRPKRPKTLPNVLSKAEVKIILNSVRNIKHKAMLSLIYSCGLRSGELLKLKFENIDSNRNLLIIKKAKGMKDRITPLSPKILEILREYYKAYSPKTFLFEGQVIGEKYSERSLQKVLKNVLANTPIKKPVTLHWLRHSYATHLLESGTDLRYIQELLGHNSSRTTEIYTHVSTKSIQNIISPFDTL
jgi:integrase/recombinase XerD